MADPSYSRLLTSCQQFITDFFQRRPFLATSAVGLSLAAVAHVVRSYRGFLALGPGGLPYNFLGWAIQAAAQPIARRDTRESRPFADPRVFARYAPHGRTSFLDGEVSARRGERPDVPSYVAPQRQMTEHADASRIKAMKAELAGSVGQHAELLALAPSGLEGPKHQALWIGEAAGKPAYLARSTKGEFAHVHPDGSSHLILSLADAETATAKGWVERHMLSGVTLPLSYVLVYAPRDEEEFQVWKKLLAASIAFNTASSKAA
ncbi:hypothetical protein ISF_03667 [Cordyceps fumosorosea ARSEF 2679]|uniref:Luciferase domain-containing protein n=1 Tax=Cordyceps fumosorosea (strain ARSEF 2679) TaxID=1081104 RepID=A0A167ZGL1_CORFA|nr:hypothetical protein ISF_03667 [Cordyceps fumosorosea ARSEF 2679]OAA67491.1 hypothetical protein ISF_03667 [Cordyceps fumosorosea ARSEF 2679]